MEAPLFFTEATEPTNIIWENRHYSNSERFRRQIRATLIIIGMILVSFVIIIICKSKAIAFNTTYPPINQKLYEMAYSSKLFYYADLEKNN